MGKHYKCNDISVALFTTEMTIIKSLSLMLKKKKNSLSLGIRRPISVH